MKSIIQIRKEDISLANQAFAELMRKTEVLINEKSLKNVALVKSKSPSELEKWSEKVIKEACVCTPFSPENVRLVSGNRFPDIVAETHYGVEVKSTTKNHWISTGSSIVESTRDLNVENIYMLFGKMGGEVPEFKCKPYQSVLSDIAVTHSPRYLINMNLKESETIFSKMNISYDELRTSKDAIEKVRKYYRQKAKLENKAEMPWWLTSDNVDRPLSLNVKLWNTLPEQEKKELKAKCLILFPEILSVKQSADKYHQAILWLCSYCQVVVPNIRDLFSAGGRIKSVNGVVLKESKPKILKNIVELSDEVKRLLINPAEDMLELIAEFNPLLLKKAKYYDNWVSLCAHEDKVVEDWIKNKPILLC